MDVGQDLVDRCQEGDREAWRELYDRTVERVYRLLRRMTGNDHDAFDLAQETYVRALVRIDQFDGRSSVSTWLYRIAVNEALQFMRREKRTLKHLQTFVEQPAPEPLADPAMARIDVNEALESLAPSDRVILLLRYQEGLDYRAMAEVLDCADGTVASRLNRARQRLRELLGRGYETGEESGGAGHPTNGQASQPIPDPRTEQR
jgi:RNA polymerase sigma-70 factor (ECF subfamily)